MSGYRILGLVLAAFIALCLLQNCPWSAVAVEDSPKPATPTAPKPYPATTPDAKEPAEEAPPLDGREGRNLALDQFQPKSTLRVPEHPLTHSKYPVVDVHVHPRIRRYDSPAALDEFVRLMDQNHIAVCISLDGQMGDKFIEHRHDLWTKYHDRWVIFANVDWRGDGDPNKPETWDCQRPDFGRRVARRLAETKAQGASGLKVFKDLGVVHRNPDGSLIRVDDPRWDPIWEAAGQLGIPVLIHSADPKAFFQPIDEHNERWEELRRHPDWSFYGPGYPTQEVLVEQLMHVVARHPETNFIGAHVASNAEDLGQVGRWLDEYKNLYVDLASRIAELGRQPYTARKFLIKYADRVLFGTDGPRVNERLVAHWRFLETYDEYFPYAENSFPPQGFWRIYGVGLPDDVLRKIYFENAERIIPGVKERYEKYVEHEKTNE